ncbi:MAG: GNAT family N-acetyltransferase [Pyramidobacter sp.]|nr:GNAT family N-acetyltransferase [Pyramidobacter sp.]
MKKLFSEIPYIESERLILRKIGEEDAGGLSELMHSPGVYRYLPTFLFEKKYEDAHEVIRRLYDECLKESLILGVFMNDEFCGLAEIYGYREDARKVSIGGRFLERFWGQGIADEVIAALVRYLREETEIRLVTASTMVENKSVTHVMQKCHFALVDSGVEEDWGRPQPTIVNKWSLPL